MVAAPAGISEADWLAWPALAKEFILAQQGELQAQKDEISQLRDQLTALATELASLRERIGRSSRNSSKPPSSDGPGFKPPERRKGMTASVAVAGSSWIGAGAAADRAGG